jgi:outer membrane protein OmpA-like peptidoglycan-associated protein
VAASQPFAEDLGGTSQGNFAYQAMFGVGVPVPWVVGLSVTAEYRFYSILGPQGFHGTSLGTVGAFGPAPYAQREGNVDINSDYNHSLLVGLRYEFNPAPPPVSVVPPPPAAPAPSPARTYLVFFDWDRDTLTPRARQIVAEAAAASTRIQTTTIEVDGYADTSHALPGARGDAYNLALSLRRAKSVRGELIRDGVPANVIDVHGYGDTHLLVSTGPNVREPQNRRVEIVLK